MSKRYFNYLVKSNKHFLFFIALIDALAIILAFMHRTIDSPSNALYSICVITGILSFVIPSTLFKYVQNKKAVDSYFSINVSRQDMLHTTLIFSGLAICIPFTLGTFVVVLLGAKTGYFIQVFLFLVMMVLSYLCLLVFNSCTYLLGNSAFDGVVMEYAYLFIPLVLYIVLSSFVDNCIYSYSTINDEWFARSSLTLSTIMNGSGLIEGTYDTASLGYWLITAVLYFCIGYYGLRVHFIRRKVERAESISNDKLSYPFIILLYMVSLLFSVALSRNGVYSYVIYLMIFVCYIVASFIYKRKIHISLKDIAVFVVTIVLALGVAWAADKTQGFGLSKAYDHEPEHVLINYNSRVTKYNLSGGEEKEKILQEYVKLMPEEDIMDGDTAYEVCIFIYGELKKGDPGYEVLNEILNRYRTQAIDDHYAGKEPNDNGFSNLYVYENPVIRITNGNSNLISYNRLYQYITCEPLSLKDLTEIAKYINVTIDYYFDKSGYRSYDLKKLLK
mgnify:FL=1